MQRIVAALFAVAALGSVLGAIVNAVTRGDPGTALASAFFLCAAAAVLEYDHYDSGPRGRPGAPRAGIDTQE